MSNLAELKAGGIFVDMENMVLSGEQQGIRFDIACLMTRIAEISDLVLRKAYGDWGRFARYRDDFTEQAFDLVQLFTTSPGKNGLDIQMSVDALEAIFLWSHLRTIFLVTGDSDYCPLIRILRKHSCRVIGIGWLEHTSKKLQAHCHEFWAYDEMAGLSTDQRKWMRSEVVKGLISQAIAELGPGECVKMSILKNALLRYDPGFDEKQYGFTKFSEFVAAYPDLQVKSSADSLNDLVQLPGWKCVERNGKH